MEKLTVPFKVFNIYMKTKEKVYCINCQFLVDHSFWTSDNCRKDENKKDTWFAPHYKFKRKPSKINKRNNCKWFIKKEENNIK
jgi:hypothetical protein